MPMSQISKTVLLHGANEGLHVTQFNPKYRPDLLPGLIACYRHVFAESPWNEWKRCTECGKKWGIDAVLELYSLNYMHCGVAVVDYWPVEEVERDIKIEVAETENSSAWLLQDGDKVVGFIWGYPMITRYLRAKLNLASVQDIVHNKFKTIRVAYLDDVGVYAEYRGRGLARILYDLWIKDMLGAGDNVVVARTQVAFGDKEATDLYHWFIGMGYEVIDQYPVGSPHEADVILAKKINPA
jgi:ribosomal protein S18 acetylase RimI-like enzyme